MKSTSGDIRNLCIPDEVYSRYMADELRGLLNRGRRLLTGRSTSEVLAAEDGLAALFTENLDELEAASFDDVEDGQAEGREWVRHSAPRLLKVQVSRLDIRGQTDFPAALWSEYFAVLGLQCLRTALAAGESLLEEADQAAQSTPAEMLGRGFIHFLDCQEALTIAELLSVDEPARALARDRAVAEQQTMNAARAARKRHQPLTVLKREMIQYYEANRHGGIAGAVRGFLKTVSEERIKECKIRNPDRVLKETLYAYRNGTINPWLLPT